ncbi:MAG: hypothetical protein F6K28_32290 [Microcoleus sp. SIO2G3]|nr:hypothetical protein [Microcoleus sp. SIO2G3]
MDAVFYQGLGNRLLTARTESQVRKGNGRVDTTDRVKNFKTEPVLLAVIEAPEIGSDRHRTILCLHYKGYIQVELLATVSFFIFCRFSRR